MPAATAYVCRIRTDVPAAAIQWLDLKPNTSQRNLVYEKVPQTGYLLGRAANDVLAALNANATVADYSGLAAYLIDNIIDQVSGITITVAVANDSADAFIAQMDAGTAIDINAAFVTTGGAGAGTTFDNAAGSDGSLRDALKILSGGDYALASGSVVGALAAPLQAGVFDDDGYRQLYSTGALQMSCAEGDLAGFAAATFTHDATAGAALVVLDAAGAPIT
jgi:hypothetical protein